MYCTADYIDCPGLGNTSWLMGRRKDLCQCQCSFCVSGKLAFSAYGLVISCTFSLDLSLRLCALCYHCDLRRSRAKHHLWQLRGNTVGLFCYSSEPYLCKHNNIAPEDIVCLHCQWGRYTSTGILFTAFPFLERHSRQGKPVQWNCHGIILCNSWQGCLVGTCCKK